MPGDTYLGSQGNTYNDNAIYAGNEERSPWRPFHVQHGYQPADSTVSIFMGCAYALFGELWQEKLTRALAACSPRLGPVLLLDPLSARELVALGFDTKEKRVSSGSRG